MSTSHLFHKRDRNAEKRQERLESNPKKLKQEERKMEGLRKKFLLEKEIKELGFVFVSKNEILYSINSVEMLGQDTFLCNKECGSEVIFNYDDTSVIIEDMGKGD